MIYERVDVYRRPPGHAEIVVYRCFRLLSGGGYVVQSADRIHFPLSVTDIANHELQLCELMREDAPEVRSVAFRSLEEAIRAFDEKFENVW